MSKKEKEQSKKSSQVVELPLIHPNAAGIDIGDSVHAVAVPAGRDIVSTRTFGTFTCDLESIVQWLKECRIETVAMESTGVYWKNLFSMLIQNGFEVYLANAKHTRNVTGRKTDETDAQWIQRLHSCGLLTSGFLPDDKIESLHSLVRHRRSLTNDSTTCILRMQKSLELMNLKVHTVISDHWLGDYFRRMRSKGGQKYAIVATARKLAIIYYRMVRYKESFTPFDYEKYKEKYRQSKITSRERALNRLKHEAAA